jgi:hypothetical protein
MTEFSIEVRHVAIFQVYSLCGRHDHGRRNCDPDRECLLPHSLE